MNNFERLKSMSVEELSEWLDTNGQWNNSPWNNWFDHRYCNNCEEIEKECKTDDGYCYCRMRLAWCEIHNRCKYFPDYDDVPDSKEIVKFWLEAEVEE